MTITLTTFIPGTKAKADEVNANFTVLKDAINEKAAIAGDSSQVFFVAEATDDSHAINKSQLDELSNDLTAEFNKTGTKFCVKSGHTTSGKGDLFSYSGLIITAKIGSSYGNLIFADYEGTQTIISSTNTLSMNGKPDGDYNLFISPEGTLYSLDNTIYRQANRPSMLDGDIWFDTSKEPFNCIKYNGTNDVEFLDMPLGKVTIVSSAITAVETFPFNQNGYNINANTEIKIYKYDYANPISKGQSVTYTAESNGLLFARHANTYDTVTVRIDNFSYVVGWSTSQGSGSSNFIPIIKGQTYYFNGGDIRYFIPEVEA